MKQSGRLKADLTLLFVAIIWGTSFVAARVAAQNIGFFLFNGFRFIVAAGFLLILMRGRVHLKRGDLKLVIVTAGALFIGSALQQAGIHWTTAGNAGFFTSLYVVIVPLILWLILHEPLPGRVWVAAILASVGALLLSTGKLSLLLAWGDTIELVGAVFWSFHVILIGVASKKIHPLPFTFAQLVIAGSVNTLLGLLFQRTTLSGFSVSIWAIIYTGVFSIGLGYSLQAYGQRHAPAVDASFILSLEAVFAAVFGWIFLGEFLSFPQWIGCGMIFFAILFSQLLDNSRGVFGEKRFDL